MPACTQQCSCLRLIIHHTCCPMWGWCAPDAKLPPSLPAWQASMPSPPWLQRHTTHAQSTSTGRPSSMPAFTECMSVNLLAAACSWLMQPPWLGDAGSCLCVMQEAGLQEVSKAGSHSPAAALGVATEAGVLRAAAPAGEAEPCAVPLAAPGAFPTGVSLLLAGPVPDAGAPFSVISAVHGFVIAWRSDGERFISVAAER